MRISEIDFGKTFHIEVVPEIQKEKFQFQKEVECKIYKRDQVFELEVRDKRILVKGKEPHHQKTLDDISKIHLPRIFWIVSKSDSSCSIQVHEFQNKNTLPNEKLEIGLDEKILNDIEKRHNKKGKEECIDWLKANLVLRFNDPNEEKARIFIASHLEESSKDGGFRLVGNNICADVKLNKDKKAYIITRIVNSKNKNLELSSLQIIETIIEFKDITLLGKIKELVQQDLSAITSQKDSYIKLWEDYNLLEEKSILKYAREIGACSYTSFEKKEENQYSFLLKENSEKWIQKLEEELKKFGTITLEAGEEIPDYLKPESTIDELEQIKEFKKTKKFIGYLEKDKITDQKLILVDEDEEKERKPPKKGVLYLSFTGDKVRIERRKDSIEIIRSGNAPISYISLFLEEKGNIPKVEYREIEPITANVKETFQGEPNSLQKQALKIAFNTPDIALIQGPPGTGKTKVISALCNRIIEEAKKNNEPIRNIILIAAFQHDAVTNAADRTEVLGLPTVKIGKKKGEDGFFSPTLNYWIQDKQELIRANLSQIEEPSISSNLKKLSNLYISYILSPKLTKKQINEILHEVKETSKKYLNGNSLDLLEKQIDKLKQPSAIKENDSIELALRTVRGIRIEPIAYNDDGKLSIEKTLKRLESIEVLNEEERNFLNLLLEKENLSSEDFDKLKELQGSWIDRLNQLKEPKKVEEFSNKEITDLFISIINELDEKRRNSIDSIIFPLNDYLDELENNPIQVKDAISYYTSVLASTVQKADDVTIYTPGKNRKETISEFNTVIVDEAARANPLDLMIPFTKAKKRIILVGDHRQLPHLLEPEVESEMESKYTQEENQNIEALLKKSLFERLFKRLKDLEKQDGIPRTITLNEQYRMHPVIGDFISKTFYEKNGDTKILSAQNPEELEHKIVRFKKKPIAWLDIPYSRGKEEYGNSGSKLRRVEAREISNLLKELIEERKEYTFGVISFYRSQVDAIIGECKKIGIFSLVNNNYVLEDSENPIEGKEERLRIGTVDSFQGKEFDVVILSMTRSNNYLLEEGNHKNYQRKYGFLLLENRLNVAMSRAKRLLIVAGDSEMVKEELAEKGIYGLTEFYKLTGGENGIQI